MIISKSKNFVYIHLEKCGGTSIEYALEPHLLPVDILLGSTTRGEKLEYSFFKKYGYQNSLKKHSSANEIKKYLKDDWNSMYKFATVRDPKDILVSLYYYSEMIIKRFTTIENLKDFYMNRKFPIDWSYEMPYLLDYCQSFIDNTFIDGFVKKVIQNKRSAVVPQTYRIDDSVELFDIKNINSNWPVILNKLGIDNNVQLNVLNKSEKPNNIKLNYESLNLIKKHYEIDYEIIPSLINVEWA